MSTRPRPTGLITFLFTDIEGSTAAWERNRHEMPATLERHDRIVRAAIERHHGYVFKTLGDGFCSAFASCREAVAAAVAVQRDIIAGDWGSSSPPAVRIGVPDVRPRQLTLIWLPG